MKIRTILCDYHMNNSNSNTNINKQQNATEQQQNIENVKKEKEKKKEDEDKHIQEKLHAHAMQKLQKENENLILMTQNYQRMFENTCECSTIAVPSKILNNAKTNWMSSEKLNELRKRAHDAVKNHKVFILKGYFHTVRKALMDRGWVEKIDVHKARGVSSNSGYLLEDLIQALPQRRPGESRKAHIQKCERSIMSRFLEHSPIDLLWCVRRDKSDWTHLTKNQNILINRFNKSPFTSKEGLCSALKDFHWYYEEGKSEAYFPRCFNVFNPEELTEFVDNFRTTACISLLRWVVEQHDEKGSFYLISEDGRVSTNCIQFAINRCKDFIDYCVHNDIDVEGEIKIWEHDWDVFLTHHYLLTHENLKFQMIEDPYASLDAYVDQAKRILEKVKVLWPQSSIDGTLNIWIIKPGNKCRGRGIMLMNNIKQIIQTVNPPITASKTRYVVQKYIERPLIIHKTKFDIRQWFLITSVQPLIIWFYKESYLRFSSQQFNLQNYHESVHLTNHAIQKKYANGIRDERLPVENMWDCHTFQAYLKQIGKYEMWSERIYPGMQRAIIGSMLACQDNMDRRPNTFELYGADFMISEDFYPWLIEINASPDLAPSTSVTARLCPQAVEDTIKVVIDRKIDQNADTGFFDMIYKQVIPKTPAYMGLNLSLKGQRIVPKLSKKIEPRCERTENKSIQSIYTLARLASSSNRIRRSVAAGPTIMDFMQCINFKSRLDREREMIRRKIRSSTLYRKPSFSKSAFNIYNVNGEVTKVSCITKNLKINEYKDEPIRKVKSPLLVNDEQEDECNNEEKSILCIGNKYLDLTSNLMAPPLLKSMSVSTINLNSQDEKPLQQDSDFEKAISQSHLSPASPSIMVNGNHVSSSKKTLSESNMQEILKNPKSANNLILNNNNSNDITASNSNNKILLSLNSDYDKTSENEEDEATENKHLESSDERESDSDFGLPSIIDVEGYSLARQKMERKRVFRSKKQRSKEHKEGKKHPVDFIKNPVFTDDKNCEIFKELETRARESVNNKKIFTIIGGFDIIRQSLIERGWIEKLLDIEANKCVVNEKLISETVCDYDARRIVLSHLVKSSPTYFIWQPRHFDGIPYKGNNPYRNRINRMRTFDYTVKEGLHNITENIQWHIIEDLTELNYPRSFLLMDPYQREYFQQEFRRSLLSCFIFFISDHFDSIFSDTATVSSEVIFVSLSRMEKYIKIKQDLYIGFDKLPHSVTFTELMRDIHQVIYHEKKIKYPEFYDEISMEKLRANIKLIAGDISIYWPESKYDGYYNIWILKPINRSRGFGVLLFKEIEKLFEHVLKHTENKYIVQKYVERPLLIYNTKFDIRQYFLTVVTKNSVNIWCYKDCYIKFSSQEFSLKNLHESIHLTNNSIQRFYSNGERNEALPEHNMWLLKEFQKYLRAMGKPNDWNNKIYPQIKKNLLAIVLASLEDTDLEENTFELNGADLMIGFDFQPILLEINGNPDLSYTTKTTRDICPRVMEDVVKVVIDLPNDPFASTGDFELIYECQIARLSPPHTSKIQLNVDGKKIMPPLRTQRQFFPLKNITELVIQGEKMLNPLKTKYCRPHLLKIHNNTKVSTEPEDDEEDENSKQKSTKKNRKLFKPTKLYRSPHKTRNIFQKVVVKPYSTDIVSYVKKLPTILQSTNRRFINLNDLMRYLKVE